MPRIRGRKIKTPKDPARANRRWKRPSQVQSLVFSRPAFSPSSSKRWATGHGFKARKVHVKPGTIRIRQQSPRKFGRFAQRKLTDGVVAVVGEPKSRGSK